MRFLEEYARQVEGGLRLDSGVDPLAHCALGITGEAGEVADLVKKSQYAGGSLDRNALVKELGDTLWYLQAIAGMLGLNIGDIAAANIVKLESRHPLRGYSIARLHAKGDA